MQIVIEPDKPTLGQRVAHDGAAAIRHAVADRGSAHIIVATGASQFEMLDALVAQPDVPWHKVHAFHLDEYAGLPITHPASFRLYLWQRFHARLPLPLASFHYLDAESDPQAAADAASEAIAGRTIDAAFIGIGENGHLAFNDPPADFHAPAPYHVVELDEACRRQQLGEGWFPDLASVPSHAVSMSIPQILAAKKILCTAPDARKAAAVRAAIHGPVTPHLPASILQTHPDTTLYLDPHSAP